MIAIPKEMGQEEQKEEKKKGQTQNENHKKYGKRTKYASEGF